MVRYDSVMRSLMYLKGCVKPDIAHTIGYLVSMANPSKIY